MIKPDDLPIYDPATADFPYGRLKDDTVAGDGTGTPVRADWQSDKWYALLAVMNQAGVAPNGNPETVNSSQFVDAVRKIQYTAPATTTLSSTDKIAVSQSGTPKQLTVGEFVQTAGIYTNKNKFINGCLRRWQESTSKNITLNTSGYTADQWRVLVAGATAGAVAGVTRQTFSAGTLPGEPQYYINVLVNNTAAPTDEVRLFQNIESVRTFAGETVTISFWAKAGSGTPSVGIDIVQNGVTGSPVTTVGKVVITPSWARYSLTVAVPAISGVIAADDNIAVRFWLSTGASSSATAPVNVGIQNGNFSFAMLQIEKGSVATDFEWDNEAVLDQKCMRFYEKSYDIETAPGTSTNRGRYILMGSTYSDGTMLQMVRFKVLKRKAIGPSGGVIFYSTGGVLNQWVYERAGPTAGTVTMNSNLLANDNSTSGFTFQSTTLGANWANASIAGHWVADARY